NAYAIKQLASTPSVEHFSKTKLQKNIKNNSLANEDNSYLQSRAVKVNNGAVIVIAHNLNDQTLVFWYLRSNESGKFKALAGKNGVIERKLFKFDNPGQLALDGNTMLYAQMSKKITKENQEVKKTQIFKFDMADVVQNLKDSKDIDECLLSKKGCRINAVSSITSHPGEINFLQYVKRTEGNDIRLAAK
ncbi:hypothetical protein ID128_01170, partial [Candidatus Wolbachia massiliensis]